MLTAPRCIVFAEKRVHVKVGYVRHPVWAMKTDRFSARNATNLATLLVAVFTVSVAPNVRVHMRWRTAVPIP